MSNATDILKIIHQAKEELSPDFLLIILGPTASGKTKLAVELANRLDGEIISADSRQVYRGMDIGTGKDRTEYGDIPYHLIDIKNPGEQYNSHLFREDFFRAYQHIIEQNKQAILCGGTGSYIQTLLQDSPYAQIPKNPKLQAELAELDKEQLSFRIHQIGIPPDLKIDFHSHKRLVRALEILLYIQKHNSVLQPRRTVTNYRIFGLNPTLEQRRAAITRRLHDRLKQGLIEEVEQLLQDGLPYDMLIYYGLEYKYVALYLQGLLSYPEFLKKLNTEIHRFAKRQMTYFRKMERDGLRIHWL